MENVTCIVQRMRGPCATLMLRTCGVEMYAARLVAFPPGSMSVVRFDVLARISKNGSAVLFWNGVLGTGPQLRSAGVWLLFRLDDHVLSTRSPKVDGNMDMYLYFVPNRAERPTSL